MGFGDGELGANGGLVFIAAMAMGTGATPADKIHAVSAWTGNSRQSPLPVRDWK